LKKQPISDIDYEIYLKDTLNKKNRLEYLKYFNVVDTQIMIPIIEGLSEKFAGDKVDMLRNLSLSSTSSQVKYALAYIDFDINEGYSEESTNTFKLTLEDWKDMVTRYRDQDKKKKLDPKNNVNEKDYDEFKKILEISVCHMCKEGFSEMNRPTLDRINNDRPHIKNNVKPCCSFCNSFKSDKDEMTMRLYIQLRKFAKKNHLPFTLCKGQEDLYKLLRKWITGGLSNIHNREDIRGKTEIKKLFYNKEIDDIDVIPSTEDKKIVSHVIGTDFNSLYPSSYSSIKHPSNPYTDNIMYMPGAFKASFKKQGGDLKNHI
jgi:hypothetical protein